MTIKMPNHDNGEGIGKDRNSNSPARAKRTSIDCVASTEANFCIFPRTKSVAMKKRTVAMTPENSATKRDWKLCIFVGAPTVKKPYNESKNQNGRLAKVIPNTR